MDKFWVVTLFHLQPTAAQWQEIQQMAMNQHEAMGIEEFSLNEEQVDALLGERSYSGGDLPQTVLDEVEDSQLNNPNNYRFFFSDNSSAESFLLAVQKLALCESQIEEHISQDWNAEWKKHYSPIEVNSRLSIFPAWQKDVMGKSTYSIFINPGMGFGTGSHETTFLCLKLFTEEVSDFKLNNILDFGSGSGILGLAALKFCPNARVDFYDIDVEANENCFQNAALNGLQDLSFRLLLPEVRDQLQAKYDLVFANILENVLEAEKNYLISMTAPGGFLILSGLLNHQVQNIETLYSTNEMKLVKKISKGDWGALLFRKDA